MCLSNSRCSWSTHMSCSMLLFNSMNLGFASSPARTLRSTIRIYLMNLLVRPKSTIAVKDARPISSANGASNMLHNVGNADLHLILSTTTSRTGCLTDIRICDVLAGSRSAVGRLTRLEGRLRCTFEGSAESHTARLVKFRLAMYRGSTGRRGRRTPRSMSSRAAGSVASCRTRQPRFLRPVFVH